MITFQKYPSLTNHYAIGKELRIVNKLDEYWYSTEKIHGANAAYYLDKDGNEAFAKRSCIIDFENSSDKQFNQLPSCVTQSIKDSAKEVLSYSGAELVIVYGEYFGAGVQVMDYDIVKSKEKSFKVFDVFIKHKDKSEDEYYVLGALEIDDFFRAKDLAPRQHIKTLRELLSDEQDDISELGGYSEGNVYKPVAGYVIDKDNRFVGVKRKTDKYLETEKVSTKQPKARPEYSIKEIEIQQDLGRYITKNRVRNVLSHGDFVLEPKSIGSIMQATKDDAIEEYKRENEVDEHTPFGQLIKGYSGKIALLIKELIQEQTNELLGV